MDKIKICTLGNYDETNKVAYQRTFYKYPLDRYPKCGDGSVDNSGEYHTVWTIEPDYSSRGKAFGYKFFGCMYEDEYGDEIVDYVFTEDYDLLEALEGGEDDEN